MAAEDALSPGGSLPVPSATDEELIRALHTWAFRDDRAPYVRNLESGDAVFLDAFAQGLLEGVRSFAPSADHVGRFLAPYRGLKRLRLWRAALRRQLEAGTSVRVRGLLELAATETLQSLQSLGILQTREGFSRDLRAAVESPSPLPPISTLGIPTANRPEILRRALESYQAHFGAFQRQVRIIISDDSRDPALAAGNRQVVAEAARRGGGSVEYLGLEERKRLIEERSGGDAVKRQALEFLLFDAQGFGQTYGMPRNALMLATVGERLLCADDDTLCNPFTSLHYRPGLEIWEGTGSASPVIEHPSRSAAVGSAAPFPGDILAVHEAFLGRSSGAALLGQTAHPGFTVGALGSLGARRLVRSADHIALSVNGLVGESGSDVEPAAALTHLSAGEIQTHQAAGHDLLQLMGSHQVVKVPDWARVASRDDVMTTFYGHDNRRWTVPFFPFLRGEDQLFKEMLIRADGGAEVVYLPVALEHAPVAANRPRPSAVSLFDMFFAALSEFPRPVPGAPLELGARALGHHLVAFSERPLPQFRRAVFEVVAIFTLQEIAQHQSFLAEQRGHLPSAVVEAVEGSLKHLETILLEKTLVYAERPWVEKLGSAEKAEEASRLAMRQMGEATATLAGG